IADGATDTVSNVERISFNGSTTTTFAIGDAIEAAPTLANSIADQQATQGVLFSFSYAADTFNDANVPLGDILTYTATLADGSALPAWLSFDPGTRTFSGTLGNGDTGTLPIKLTATDAKGQSVSDPFAITEAVCFAPGTRIRTPGGEM